MRPPFSPASATFVVLLLAAGAFANPPRVDSLSATEVTPGEFIRLHGEYFGNPGPSAWVEIGSTRVATAKWTDTTITAYASEGVVDGQYAIRVITPTGLSNSLQVEVLPQRAPVGRVAWRFRAEGPYGRHRPSVGPDGTVYFGDVRGFVYALTPEGRVRWIHDASLASGAPAMADYAPVAIGDGKLYVTVDPLGPQAQVHALGLDGTLQWIHTAPDTTSILAGPSVGPDGNVYVLFQGSAGGLTSLTPDGAVRWTNPGSLPFAEFAVYGAEIVFGPGTSGEVDQLYLATDQRAGFQVPPIPSFWAFGLDGTERFRVDTGSQSSTNQGQPVVAPDGTVYLSARHQLIESVNAFGPHGGRLWSWNHPSAIDPGVPAIAPDGTIFVLCGGGVLSAINPTGTARFNRTLGTSGDQMVYRDPILHPSGEALMLVSSRNGSVDVGVMAIESRKTFNAAVRWREEIPVENGFRYRPTSPLVYSADGARAYVVGGQPGQPVGEETWTLFAIDEDACLSTPEGCLPVVPDAGVGMEEPDAGMPDAGVVVEAPADAGTESVAEKDAGMGNDPEPPQAPGSGCTAAGGATSGALLLWILTWRFRRVRKDAVRAGCQL